jgi:predicted N-acyltransferase
MTSAPEVVVADRIAEVDAVAWDQLAGSNFYLGRSWLRLQERLNLPVQRRYIQICADGVTVGAVPIVLADKPTSDEYDPQVLLSDLPHHGRGLTLAGNTRGYWNRLMIDPAYPRSKAVRDALVQAVTAQAQSGGAWPVWWLYLDTESAHALGDAYGTTPAIIDADCEIPLSGSAFQDYLDTLTPSRAREVRRERKRYAAAGYDDVEGRMSTWPQQIATLLCNTQRRYGLDVSDYDMRSVLDALRWATSDSGVIHGTLLDGELLAYSLAFAQGQKLHLRVVGFDYERLKGVGEYFEVCFYRPIEHAMARGLRALHLGTASYMAKVARGARLVPLWAVCSDSTMAPPQLMRRQAARHTQRIRDELGPLADRAFAHGLDQWSLGAS